MLRKFHFRRTSQLACTLLVSTCCLVNVRAQDTDTLLRAMRDEIERSRQLRIPGLDAPYFFEYRVEDTKAYSITASLGALIASNESRSRTPMVAVRVGDYNFDNTNHLYSDAYSTTRYDSDRLALDDNYLAIRHTLWLATDREYKAAEDAIARKRSSLKNVNIAEPLPDFSKASPVQAVLPTTKPAVDVNQWKDRVVRLSAILNGYPQVVSSGLEMEIQQSTNYLVNSEGSVERTPEDLAYIRIQAYGLAHDGASVRDAEVVQAFNPAGLPDEADLRRQVSEVGQHVTALAAAAPGEAYDGPILFESRAAAQMFAEVLGDNLKVTRKPVADPGRNAPHRTSELENRMGAHILPEWMDVVDDPTLTQFGGHTLLGHYEHDIEGLSPQPLALVQKGQLKAFLLTRTPVAKGFETSNARARMTGSFGARGPGFGNLFIRASETQPLAQLKKSLIDLCQMRDKPYGILVRKIDFPSSATAEEFRRMAGGPGGRGGGATPQLVPLLVYKVYPDGKEELIRGMRFRGLTTRSLKDIVAASGETAVFDFIDSNAPLALMGAGSYTLPASVIAPAVLFDELELEPVQEEVSKPPIVPAPPLTTAIGTAAQPASGF